MKKSIQKGQEPALSKSSVPVRLDLLSEHPENPNRGNVDLIVESIEENGFFGGIIAQKSTGFVLDGNHRLLAARAAGLEEIEVFWMDIDDEQAVRIMIVANEITRKSRNDPETLLELLTRLNNSLGLKGSGFDQSEFDRMIEESQSGWTSDMTGGGDPPEHSGLPAAFIKITIEDPDDKPILIQLIHEIINEKGIQATAV
jgi:hypothetical protein